MPSKKQLAARAKFAYIMKHGGFKKSRKQGSKQIRRKKLKLVKLKIKARRGYNQSTHDSTKSKYDNLVKRAIKALNDGKTKSITIKK